MEGLRPPLSLYVHLPWCVKKCPYCDFNSYATAKAPPRQRYLRALVADLARESDRAAGSCTDDGAGTNADAFLF